MRFIRLSTLAVVTVIILMPVALSAVQAEYISENNTITVGGGCPTVVYNSNGGKIIGKWVFLCSGKTWSVSQGQWNLEYTNYSGVSPVLSYTSANPSSTSIDAGIRLEMTPSGAAVNCIAVINVTDNGWVSVDFDRNGVATYNGFNNIGLSNHSVDINITLKLRYTTTVTVAEQPRLSFVFTMYDQGTTSQFVYAATAI